MASDESSRRFETTRWNMVLGAGEGSGGALAKLCAVYWFPVYAYLRATQTPGDALDLTRGFFARLLAESSVAAADPARGRFRNWLLKAVSHHRPGDVAHPGEHPDAVEHPVIDAERAEERYQLEPAGSSTPERCYERRWGLTLLEHVLQRLGDEHEKRGEGRLFERVRPCLVGDDGNKQREMAEALGMDDATFKHHVRRSKIRLGELLVEEVAETLSRQDDIEQEMLFLREVLEAR